MNQGFAYKVFREPGYGSYLQKAQKKNKRHKSSCAFSVPFCDFLRLFVTSLVSPSVEAKT